MHIARIAFILSLTLAAMTIAGDAQAQNAVISIDNVTYEYTPTQLRAGGVHQVSIRYNCLALSPTGYWIGSNGFEIYSPDGADWGYFKGYAGPLVATAAGRGSLSVFEKHFSFDNFDGTGYSWKWTSNDGHDPVPGNGGSTLRGGFYLAWVSLSSDAGLIGGTDNDIAVKLEFTTSHDDAGLTICLNTCNQIVAWTWASGGTADYPRWDNGLGVSGPRC